MNSTVKARRLGIIERVIQEKFGPTCRCCHVEPRSYAQTHCVLCTQNLQNLVDENLRETVQA